MRSSSLTRGNLTDANEADESFASPQRMAESSRIETYFARALELDTTQRGVLLRAIGEADPELATELKALLAADRLATTRELQRAMITGAAGPATTPTPPTPPKTIGPFRILALLGEGGMGSVYRAEQLEPVHRFVAIKLIRTGLEGSPTATARFEIERRAIARMDHPGIARILDAGALADGRAWFAMEFIDGLPIHEHVRHHAMDTAQRVRLLADVARAVAHAHRRGVLHRDLKVGNVLVATVDGRSIPKVIDFGVAKALDDERAPDLTVESGIVPGTIRAMSPEQLLGDHARIDVRTDIWGLGVIAWELLADRPPFRTTRSGMVGEREVIDAILHLDRWSLRKESGAAAVDADLEAVVARCLEKDPENRYPTADALVADLEAWLDGGSVSARVLSSWERACRSAWRHRFGIGIVALVIAALAAGLIVASSERTVAQHRLVGMRRLADSQIARDLEEAAATGLLPALPSQIPAYDRWLADFAALRDRLPMHRAMIGEIDDPGFAPTEHERAWIRTTVDELVARVERMTAVGGLEAAVRQRREVASRLRRIEAEHALAWSRAIDTIADARQCPRYAGLRIAVQPGLVPLGRNSNTGLYEFWHVLSGDRPDWRDGEVRSAPADGVILILIPGGRVPIGCAQQPPGEKAGPMCDPLAGDVEQPVHAVELQPYFLARHEFTQAQWLRVTGSNPSRFRSGVNLPRGMVGDTNPVEQVTWNQCSEVFAKLGLALPTEAQWERGCRADTRSSFWCGYDPAILMQLGCNIADEGSVAVYPKGWSYEAGVDDGHTSHAPVGSFSPNPFGLFDMHGNVEEWCKDAFLPYTHAPRGGDGLRDGGSDTAVARAVRGGCFNFPLVRARSSSRMRAEAGHAVAYRGVRAAAALR
jgi:formylglycine-generating enzyme required for sulfatase activity